MTESPFVGRELDLNRFGRLLENAIAGNRDFVEIDILDIRRTGHQVAN